MAPYNLYLLNPNAKDTLRFAVGNLHPGEKKQTVICVSNQRPRDYIGDESAMSELVKDSEFGYDLMLVYTENLAVNYTIYPLEQTYFEDWDKEHDEDDPLPDGAIIMDDDTKEECFWTKILSEDKKEEITLPGSFMTDEMRQRAGTYYDISEGDEPIVNAGAYWISEDDTMELAYSVDDFGNGSYDYNYYLIEIDWKKIDNFDIYRKETDMVYVVVNAKQPRPILEEPAVQLNEESGVLIDGKSENLTDDAD